MLEGSPRLRLARDRPPRRKAARRDDKANPLGRLLRFLGPGLITGAADDDPSGIATYSQTGAQFGFGQLWTAIFMLPLQIATQEACARIGAVTGQGIAGIVRRYYSRPVLYAVVLLVLVANTINLGADLGAMAAATNLLVPLPLAILTVIFAAAILGLEIFTTYRAYARILKWLALALLAYPLTVLIVRPSLPDLLIATFLPHVELSFAFLFIITGVLGTTISPYMFFWQASEEVEEEIAQHHFVPGQHRPRISWSAIADIRADTAVGMVFSELGTWSIIVVTATVLHQNHVTDVRTAADAARALEPLVQSFPDAGVLAKGIFAVGVIGLGLLGVPVLAASAAYALAEAFGWHEGLSRTLRQAPGFYGVIGVATLVGLLMNFVGIDPIAALVYTAVINGVVAVPLILVIALIAGDPKIMGKYTSRRISKAAVWATFVAMGAAALTMFASALS